MTYKVRLALAAICALALLAAPSLGNLALAGQDLPAFPIGQVISAQTGSDSPAGFVFNADSAGFLTVVVRGDGESDLKLLVSDDVGLTLPGGAADVDTNGDLSAEQATVVIPRAGTYHVYVEAMYDGGSFNIGGAWIPFPELTTEPDVDGHPTTATALMLGSPMADSVDGTAGDMADWYSVTSDTAGMVTVIIEAPEGDLALEVYKEGEYRQYLDNSDQDMQGVTGNESLSSPIAAGQTLYFRVLPVFEGGGLISYTIRAGVM